MEFDYKYIGFAENRKAAVIRAEEYGNEVIYEKLKAILNMLDFRAEEYYGKKVVLKPNLLLKFAPERAATVHPSVVYAAGKIFADAGASVLLAESPGGPYTPGILKSIYKVSGMEEAARAGGFELNYDTSFEEVRTDGGERSNHFDIIKPILDADLIVDLCKLKSHSMATMTAAVKNLFGVIPGTRKVEFHSRFPKHEDFAASVVGLTSFICKNKKVLSICDAIIGMEGNGPSGGKPKKIGCLLASENPFALDLLCAYIIGAQNTVPMLENAKKRGYAPADISGLMLSGDDPRELVIKDFRFPDTHKLHKLDFLPKFLQPHPKVNKKKCIGCGECARSCPQKVIKIENGKAMLSLKNCIRCYCCQELCKLGAITIHRSLVYRIVG